MLGRGKLLVLGGQVAEQGRNLLAELMRRFTPSPSVDQGSRAPQGLDR